MEHTSPLTSSLSQGVPAGDGLQQRRVRLARLGWLSSQHQPGLDAAALAERRSDEHCGASWRITSRQTEPLAQRCRIELDADLAFQHDTSDQLLQQIAGQDIIVPQLLAGPAPRPLPAAAAPDITATGTSAGAAGVGPASSCRPTVALLLLQCLTPWCLHARITAQRRCRDGFHAGCPGWLRWQNPRHRHTASTADWALRSIAV